MTSISSLPATRRVARPPGMTVTVVGAGGNIGSQLVPLLATMPNLTDITLVDPDSYEAGNLLTQNITPRDIGRLKVAVQARRLRGMNKNLRVKTWPCRVADVPWGCLQSDVLLSCTDSRDARMDTNQIARRLRIPLVDAAVDARQQLARVNVYGTTPDEACLICAWDEHDFAALPQVQPCLAAKAESSPTDAPTYLGALAASLQAAECRKLLTGELERVMFGKQVMIDLRHHQHYVTNFGRNSQCRLDHAAWEILHLPKLPSRVTLSQALGLVPATDNARGGAALNVENRFFLKARPCPGCGRTLGECLWRGSRSSVPQQVCRHCSRTVLATGFDQVEWLNDADISPAARYSALSEIGFLPGDVFGVRRQGTTVRFQLPTVNAPKRRTSASAPAGAGAAI